VGSYVGSERKAGREPIFDLSGIDLHPPDPGPVAGLPLGGVGCGAIGRGWRGDFNRWTLWPGRTRFGPVAADQFALRVQPASGNKTAKAVVLGCPTPAATKLIRKSSLRSWDWDMDPAKATYYGCFPRAWTVYEDPIAGVRLVCKQVSPVVPGDYAASSLPAAAFVWTVENTSSEPLDVSLMFSFQNGDGGEEDAAGGHRNEAFTATPEDLPVGKHGAKPTVVGVALKHKHRTRVVFDPANEAAELPTPLKASQAGRAKAAAEAEFVTPETVARHRAQAAAAASVEGGFEDASASPEALAAKHAAQLAAVAVDPKLGGKGWGMGSVFEDDATFGVAALAKFKEVSFGF